MRSSGRGGLRHGITRVIHADPLTFLQFTGRNRYLSTSLFPKHTRLVDDPVVDLLATGVGRSLTTGGFFDQYGPDRRCFPSGFAIYFCDDPRQNGTFLRGRRLTARPFVLFRCSHILELPWRLVGAPGQGEDDREDGDQGDDPGAIHPPNIVRPRAVDRHAEAALRTGLVRSGVFARVCCGMYRWVLPRNSDERGLGLP